MILREKIIIRTKLLILFAIFTLNISSAQVIGKIFDKDYANREFGEILSSVTVENYELVEILNSSEDYVMLNISTGILRAIDNNRNSLKGFADSDKEVFYKMSVSQVNLLLKKGSEKITKIEMRPETLTLTNGQYTIEMTLPCPPYCE